MKLVPVEKIKEAKSIEKNNYKELTQKECEELHYFGCRKRGSNLDITISGITLGSGYEEVKFYKSNEKFGAVTVKGIKPNGKCDFLTENMDEMIEECDEVDFWQGLNGGVIATARKGDKVFEYDNASTPVHSVGNNGKIRAFKTQKVVYGKNVDALVIAIKDGENTEFFMDGEKLTKEMMRKLDSNRLKEIGGEENAK